MGGRTDGGLVAWFDCGAGASGDMMLGALLDAGAPLEAVQQAVDAVAVERVTLGTEAVQRHGIAATRVDVRAPRTNVVRTWGEIRRLLEDADLPEPARARAVDVFERLARAEAAAHRTSPEQVHFHEVGALDAIADVVGACTALHHLGVTEAVASPVALGSGMTRSEHGLMPVPPPAVVAVLGEVGAPVYAGDAPYEMCTPTGAALLAATVTRWGQMPMMRIVAAGHGAGSREVREVPNVLRVVVGEPVADAAATRQVAVDVRGEVPDVDSTTEIVLQSNVDDLDPRLWPPVLARLLEAGASDAWLDPIVMKKGRPAYTLSVLVPHESVDAVRRIVFTETSTIGVRESAVTKRALRRETRTVTVSGMPVRVKIALLDGAVVNVQPEYEDVLAAAAALDRPVKSVLAMATAAADDAGLTPG